MNIYEIMFLLQFLVIMGLLLAKLYNVMSKGEKFDLKISFIMFIAYFLFYLVGLIVFLANPEEIIYISLFTLESWLIILNVLFFIIELFLNSANIAITPVKSYNAKEAYKVNQGTLGTFK